MHSSQVANNSHLTFLWRKAGESRAMRISCEPGIAERKLLLCRFGGEPEHFAIVAESPIDISTPAPSTYASVATVAKDACISPEPPDADYCNRLTKLISLLKKSGGKTVISRIISTKTTLSAETIFIRLCHACPQANVFAWQRNDECWIGATPELLLDIHDNTLTTMSLAGTRPAGTKSPWDEKNLEEQQIVTDYILSTLRGLGFHPECTGPVTRKAGPVEHLCTMITSSLGGSHLSPEAIAGSLAPTPAVAGYPKDIALERIANFEPHDREFYAGYFGMTSPRCTELYVTLRCMRLHPSGNVDIYVGGGITPRSGPVDEWRETCNKALTLQQIL